MVNPAISSPVLHIPYNRELSWAATNYRGHDLAVVAGLILRMNVKPSVSLAF